MIHHGDCLEVLRTLPSDSLDSLVTDPPAGIAFMGKDWDKDKGGRAEWVAWMTDVMRECLRVLKPGAHGLVWALPRTAHWTATALEDAGFEVRDCVTHLFGTGFPKSLDVSKAIDKAAGAEREVVGVKPGHEDFAHRKTKGHIQTDAQHGEHKFSCKDESFKDRYHLATAPATDSARQWQGWGTAIKPSWEGWWLVRKPMRDVDGMAIIASQLEALWSALSAASADESSKSTSVGSAREKASTAHAHVATSTEDGNARLTETGRAVASSEQTATSASTSVAINTSLSIVSSWKRTLDESLALASTSTTATATKPIIDLKTLSSSLSRITPESITQGVLNPSGPSSDVLLAAGAFAALRASLPATQTPSAPERASDEAPLSVTTALVWPEDVAERLTGPSAEFAWLVRKPCSEKTVAANVLRHGTGAINVDSCRVGGSARNDGGSTDYKVCERTNALIHTLGIALGLWGREPGEAFRLPNGGECAQGLKSARDSVGDCPSCRRLGDALLRLCEVHDQGNAPLLRDALADISRLRKGFECNPSCRGICRLASGDVFRLIASWGDNTTPALTSPGRFPANLVFSHSEGCADVCEPTCAVRMLDEQSGHLHGAGNKRDKAKPSPGGYGGQITGEKNPNYYGDSGGASRFFYCAKASRSDRGENNKHPTVKSTRLMSYLVRLVTPPNGTVLDPFAGSGSTGVAALAEGMTFVGIEQDATYVETANARLSR